MKKQSKIPKGSAAAKLDVYGIDAFCDAVLEGRTMTAIASEVGVSIGTLITWLAADPDRSACAREARIRTARLWDDKAEQGIADAADPFELSRAKELAHHYRWRAAKIAPREYGDKLAIGGADDMPAIKTDGSITIEPAEAYKRMLGG